MTELIIDDFKLGLDLRRSVLTAPPGSLRKLENCLINSGGEIEKRAAFVQVTTLPAGTFGLTGLNNQLHVFSTSAVTIDPGTALHPYAGHVLTPVAGKTIEKLLDVEGFQSEFMVTAENTDGTQTNWWNGAVTNVGTEGDYLRIYQAKMYRTSAQYLRFSGVNDPMVEDPASVTNPGAGFIDLSSQDSESSHLQGLEIYYGQMAIFARLVIQLWALDPDPASNTFKQLIRIGTVAPQSVHQFGTGDVLFLSDSGVRSLRAINASMAAAVNDVGSPIDSLMIDQIRNNWVHAEGAYSIVQPIWGRYWLSIGSTIYVLSYHPSAKISAWSTFTVPFTIDYMTTCGNQVYLRSGDDVYLYAGPDGVTYDTTTATVITPMMSADNPTTWKKPISIDLMVFGTWTLEAGMLANLPDARELVGTFEGETYSLQAIPYAGYGTHIGLTLTTSDPSPALLGSMTVNFQKADVK